MKARILKTLKFVPLSNSNSRKFSSLIFTMNVLLFSTPICKQYLSSRFSFTNLCIVILAGLSIILPYMVVRDVNPLTIRHDHPLVNTANEVLFVLQSESREIFFSTIPELNDLRPESFGVASISLLMVNDRIELSIEFPLQEKEQIFSLNALIFIDYRLQNANVGMQGLVYIHHDGGLPGSSFTTSGDLVLRQNKPLGNLGQRQITELYPTNAIMHEFKAARSSSDCNIDALLARYEEREIAPYYSERVHFWHRNPTDKHSDQDGFDNNFNVKVTVNVPNLQEVVYISTLSQVLLDAWMRYLSILVVAVYCMRRLLSFLFSNQILSSRIHIDTSI